MPTFIAARPILRVLAALGLTLGAGACQDLTSIDASFQNITLQDTAYAVNGGPPNAPNSVKFFDIRVERADQGFGFDVAFDIDANGNPVIIPAAALASSLANPHPYSVALQAVSGPFQTVLEAPKDGYRADTAIAVVVGQTIVAESRDLQVCGFAIKGQSYYSKIVIDEVDSARRRIVFTVTVNRNCGFRSFAPGIPRD